MARDDDDDSLPPLGDNTQKFLEDAKKGKNRTFLLVCKGNKVKYLAVNKKPVKKSELNEAKKLGYKGDGFFGVVTGKGMDLVFNLSIADGYTSEPIKDKALKDFLEEKANFKCKPTILIVATLPDIPFDDEDLAHPLVARFVGLSERISSVMDVRPEAEAELKKSVAEIRLLLLEGDFKAAEPLVDALPNRLQVLLNGGSSATLPTSRVEPPTPTQQVDNDALKAKLQAALNKLVPQLKEAVANHPEKKVELLTPVAQIKKQMDSGELDEAKNGILAVGQLLKSVLAQGVTPGKSELPAPSDSVSQSEFERKLATLQSNYDRALQEKLGDATKFRSVMAYAIEQAAAGVYGNAIKAIDRLSQAVEQAIASGTEKPRAPSEVPHASGGDVEVEPERVVRPGLSDGELRLRLAGIEPIYLSTLAGNPADRTRISATMSMAIELIDNGEFDRAATTLDRLEKLLANPGEPDIKPTLRKTEEPFYNVIHGEGQLVKYRKALLAWDAAKRSAASQLANLKSTVAEKSPSLASF